MMKGKAVSGIMVTLLLTSMLTLAFNINRASASYRVHNIDTGESFATIQEAIDDSDTLNGHTIFVEEGTFYENVVVSKSLTLIGASEHNTIIDGNGSSTVWIPAGGSTITRFTIRKGSFGVNLGSSSNRITGNIFTENDYDIQLFGAGNNFIKGNTMMNSSGRNIFIAGRNARNNTIIENTIPAGIEILYSGGGNIIYHNNIGAAYVVYDVFQDEDNVWDNGYPSGGNYWGWNVTLVDKYHGFGQNQNGSDGIGDTFMWIPIEFPERDRYPLMGPVNAFDAGIWDNIAYSVNVAGNSTVSDFYFNPQMGAFIRFDVDGPDNTTGFCRVTIPKQLLSVNRPEEWIVMVGNDFAVPEVVEDEDYTYLYFTYSHSVKTVTITGIRVVPEFPQFLILPLFMITTLLAVIVYRRKRMSSKIK